MTTFQETEYASTNFASTNEVQSDIKITLGKITKYD